MATRELSIRLRAEDAGATAVVNRLNTAIRDVEAKGGDRSIVFDAEFREGLVSQIVNDEVAKMQAAADRQKIQVEAEMIAADVNTRLFGDEVSKKPITFSVVPEELKPEDIDSFLSANAKEIERSWASEFDPVSKRVGKEFGEHTGDEAGGGFINSLKSSLGKHSAAGEVGELVEKALKGGGVLFAAGLGARLFAEAGESAKQLSEKLATGELDAAGVVRQGILMTPVFGDAARGATAIWQAFDHGAMRAAAMTENAERLAKATEEAELHAKGVDEALAGIRDRPTPGLSDHIQKLADSERQYQEDQKSIAASQAEAEKLRLAASNINLTTDDPALRKANSQKLGEISKEYYDKLDEIEAAKSQAKTDRQKRDADADADAQQQSDDAFRQQQDAFNSREIAAEQEHYAAMQEAGDESNQKSLESQGRYLDARLAAVEAGYQRELDAADSRREKEQEGLEENDPRFEAANKRFDESVTSAETRKKADTKNVTDDDARDRAKEEQDFRRKQADEAIDLQERQLRALGNGYEADRLAAAKAQADKLADLKGYYDEQRRLHAERTGQLDQQQAESEATAQRAYAESIAELQQKSAGEFSAVMGRRAGGQDDRFSSGVRDDQLARVTATQKPQGLTKEQGDNMLALLKTISENQIVIQQVSLGNI